ncbi:MAG TPA: sugar ABC transporter substrate-binding protein [Bauldia sp.]|nr:sugar ABC transporter substrate-binding protein [Bauldia sp.]
MNVNPKAVLFASTIAAFALGGGVATAGEILWWTPNWGEARAKELADKFMAANPGITVKMEVTVSDGLPTRIQTALRSGSPPDLIEAQHGWVVPYAQAGLLAPLDDVLAALGADDFVPASLKYDTWDGHVWGIPYRIETHGVLYNKGAFKAAGLDPEKPPETWSELIEVATKLTGKGANGQDQYGFAITGGGEFGNTVFRSLPFIWMNGGSIISDDMTKATVNEPAAVEAVTFYTDFLKKGLSPPSTLQNDGTANRRLFIAETVAMYQSGQFDVGSIRKENPNIDIGVMMIPHPEGKETAAILGGWSFIVPKDAPNPDETKKFIEFLAQSENMGFFTDTFPARVSAMEMERFKDPILTVFKAMLPHGRTLPPHKNWIPITQAYFDGVQSILLGDAEPQEAMDIAAEEIQALLDQ